MAEAGDVPFHGCNLFLFPFVLLHLVFFELGSGLDVLVVVAGVELQLSVLHVDDVGAHAVQEILRVGDNNEDAVELL